MRLTPPILFDSDRKIENAELTHGAICVFARVFVCEKPQSLKCSSHCSVFSWHRDSIVGAKPYGEKY